MQAEYNDKKARADEAGEEPPSKTLLAKEKVSGVVDEQTTPEQREAAAKV